MQLCHTILELHSQLTQHRQQKIALVPTMGNLHDGHIELVKVAKQHADIVVVSIFVNPTQFGANEDFDNYPRTLEEDCQKLKDVNTHFVFVPSIQEMYPTYPPNTQILNGAISKILCGNSRPTHFDGVGLVVSKLFNIVRPNIAVFGKKDYQQLAIINQLNQELNFGIDIIGVDIVRADDGLALSSRNGYLTKQERAIAPIIYQTLTHIKNDIMNAPFEQYPIIIQKYLHGFYDMGLTVDYLQLLNQKLKPIHPNDKQLVVLTAIFLGRARLLDNLEINLP